MIDKLYRITTKRMFRGKPLTATLDRHSRQTTQEYIDECKRKGVEIISIIEYVVDTYHYDKEDNIDFGEFKV